MAEGGGLEEEVIVQVVEGGTAETVTGSFLVVLDVEAEIT